MKPFHPRDPHRAATAIGSAWSVVLLFLTAAFVLGAHTQQPGQMDLTLPRASEIKAPDNPDHKNETTTLNLFHRRESPSLKCSVHIGGGQCRNDDHWMILIGTHEYTLTTVAERLHVEANALIEKEATGLRLSARRILIRADQAAPYGYVQRIIGICAAERIYKIAVAAQAKNAEGQFECWLPRGESVGDVSISGTGSSEMHGRDARVDMRVALFWDDENENAVRRFGRTKNETDEQLLIRLKLAHDDATRLNKRDAPITIDATAKVSWVDVVNVINLCKKAKLDNIEFALTAK